MKLLTYIDIKIHQQQSLDGHESSLSKLLQLRRQLANYDGCASDTDLLLLIDDDFVMGFAKHLFAVLGDNSRNDTVYGWLEILRRTTRSAIHHGYLPNVDVFPDVLSRLRTIYPLQDAPSEVKRMYAVSVTESKREFDKLLLNISSRQQHDGNSRNVLIYLFGLLCYGIELRQVLTLRVQRRVDGNVVRLERYGLDVPVDGLLARLVELYNRRGYAGELLFDTLDGVSPERWPEVIESVKRGVSAYMADNSLVLFRSHSIMSDWLSIAVCNGLPTSCVSRVVHSTFGHAQSTEQYDSDIKEVYRYVKDSRGYLKHYWRVLCSYSQTLKADQLEKKIKDLCRYLPRDVRVGLVRCYNPYETVVSKVDGKMVRKTKPVFGRYLFVKCSLSDCDTIERYVTGTSFLRRPNQPMERATVSDIEMSRMMSYMQNYGEYSQLVELDQWSRQHEASLGSGQRVRVQDGPYAGYDGIIVETKSTKQGGKPQRQFIVRITGLPDLAIASNVTAQLRGLSLKPL